MAATDVIDHADWLAALRERFGDSPKDWAFTCPSCGDTATGADMRAALEAHPITRSDGTTVTASDILSQQCIGRTLGALTKGEPYTGRGCDWSANGLFRGPVIVRMPDGSEAGAFRMAEVTA